MANAPLKLTRRGQHVLNVLSLIGVGLGAVALYAVAIMFGGR